MFKAVNNKTNFPQMEESILKLWKDKKVFEKSIENREGGPRFVLYEGPPTANGTPGIHFVMPRVLKDIIPRFKVMKGFYAPRIGGWDTHGLPVELEVEKELGFSGKEQIEEYGIEKFNALCRQSVLGYIKEFEDLTERIGYWCDMDNAYVTMKNEYIETSWWAIKQMWDKELVYQGYRVTPHCPRCGTSLSSHEVAQGYQDDTEDPSVYIKFKISLASLKGSAVRDTISALFKESGKPAYLLAWTTTPWTLPGNTALAVAPDDEYAVVETDNEFLVLASVLLEPAELGDAVMHMKVEGNDLVDLRYEPLFNPHKFGVERLRFVKGGELQTQEPDDNLTYRVIGGDFVSMEDGTGIVHIAPAYGEIDYGEGQVKGLDFIHQVDLQGNLKGSYPFSGKFVKDADPLVLEELQKKGLLHKAETIRHTYPFCWRCDAPLLYYAKETWYIRTTAVKDRLISGNSEINWYPEHIKQGRFGDWLENNIDWAFSRERYWGTPLPVWQCLSCGEKDCVGGVEDLKSKEGFSGMKEPLDLHRPFVDEVTYKCHKCGGEMKRVQEVIDCWFDSGAMPIAQSHYPFENETLIEDGRFPADFICEAIDQTRGWFYSLHAISTLLFDRPSYRNVICHGHILDAKGEKMSKSRGNMVSPWDVLNKYGADALRWYIYTAAPLGNSMRFEETALTEISRRLLMTLWNVYSFFVTYANIDNFVPDLKHESSSQSELDRWIFSELNQLIMDVDTGLEQYDPRSAAWKIAAFVDVLSNWYVRRSRRRFWKSENDTDKLSAYNTLYQCLVTLSKLMAPFTPFIAEELYQNLVCSIEPGAPESVHLTDFPVADESKIDLEIVEANRLAMNVSSQGLATRSKAGIKVRQPLSDSYVSFNSERERRGLENTVIKKMIEDELNVKWIKLATPEELAAIAKNPDYVVDNESAPSTAINIKITTELKAEGMAREIVRRVQTMRRSAGFDISDHIEIFYEGDEYVAEVMAEEALADYIKQETLSSKLAAGVPEEVDYREDFKLSSYQVTLGVKKLD
ncbi:isoleucine--tRNA ligase [Chloroflexota bacterium]